MADVFTRRKRSEVMSAIRGRGNKSTEHAIKQLLRSEGIHGWRSNPRDVFGCPDIIFPGRRVAIFLDGCFWHGCARCGFRDRVASNREFWLEKISRNTQRDRKVNRTLKNKGWHVLRLWEHDIEKKSALCLAKILRVLLNSDQPTHA